MLLLWNANSKYVSNPKLKQEGFRLPQTRIISRRSSTSTSAQPAPSTTFQNMKTKKPLRQKTPLKAKSRLKARPPKKKPLRTNSRRPKRMSLKLGINLSAKYPKYKRWGGHMMRYRGLKGIAWEIFSQYVRKRDGYKCSTCYAEDSQIMDAGHYIPAGLSSNSMVCWDEYNVHCQCRRCNRDLGGLQDFLGDYIERKYGREIRDDLKRRAYIIDPVTDWEEVIVKYENKLEALN